MKLYYLRICERRLMRNLMAERRVVANSQKSELTGGPPNSLLLPFHETRALLSRLLGHLPSVVIRA